MAIIKCKMCGGNLVLIEGQSVSECEYCGSRQTVPVADDEKKLTLFARANRLRAACEFDKAAGIYEAIVADFPEEAEAYWGLVLCKYGIEYVDDPATGKKIPTCHRSSYDSVLDDSDFEQVMENADTVARRVYRDEAKQIEELRKGIIEVSGKEEPYDIFICYKETAENGDRTLDSVLAQDIYDALANKGYRTFFARITLEDKLGQEYEPYIFAALNSARIMLAVGTCYEHYNAVWVKNEWSRYLKLMVKDKDKHLIPCFKNLDAYDIPKEFARLQAQDLGKVGAMQDLLRGIEKILPREKTETVKETVVVQQSAAPASNTAPLLKRAFIFLEDGDWNTADEYCEKVLDIDPENAQAYLGKLMAELGVKKQEDLRNCAEPFDEYNHYQKAVRFGDKDIRKLLDECRTAAKQLNAEAKRKKEAEWEAVVQHQRRLRRVAGHICAAADCTIGLNVDGTVVAAGKYDKTVHSWSDIIAVSGCLLHAIGLKADGTLVTAGKNQGGCCDVHHWSKIVAVSTGGGHTVGLKADGTIVAVGKNGVGQCNVSGWKDIIAISAGGYHTVGLKSDGTVVAVGDNDYGQCNVSGWKDIIAISAGGYYTVGLKADGTVVAVGDNDYGQCNVSGWKDIVAISAGHRHSVGLKADGTVVAQYTYKMLYYGQCDVSDWKDIVAISAGFYHTVGLKSDGTVVAVGNNDYGYCKVSGWRLFRSFHTLEEDHGQAAAHKEAERKQQAQWQQAGLCRHCGGKVTGFLFKKCVNCGEPKDY